MDHDVNTVGPLLSLSEYSKLLSIALKFVYVQLSYLRRSKS